METDNTSMDRLAEDLRDIYLTDEVNGAAGLEKHLMETLADRSLAERNAVLDTLIEEFRESSGDDKVFQQVSSDQFNKLLTMLLGKEILQKNLPPDKLIEQLATAINTVFDSVNTLNCGINAILMGSAGGEETIRLVIRSSMDADEGIGALKKFLDQTGEFFAIALKAYKESAQVKIAEIIEELNPENLERESDKKVKFGPLHKANLYDCYQDKFRTIQNWQRSGLLLEAFMKEFEKNCHRLHSTMSTE